MEEIYICCGLGDCLLYCQMYDLYRDTFKYQYVLNDQFVILYRDEKYFILIQQIFHLFKVPLKIKYEKNNFDVSKVFSGSLLLKEYPIKKNTIINYIPTILTDLPSEYIVINTNIRVANAAYKTCDLKKFYDTIDNICYFLNNLNFNLQLVIIGHQKSIHSYDVINYSFYDKLIHAKFIDKTYNNDLIHQSNINNLIYDINILKNKK